MGQPMEAIDSGVLAQRISPELSSNFVRRQLRDIRRGGVMALRYKIFLLQKLLKKILISTFVFPFFVLPLIVIRCMRPWLLVRLGELESSGIGHLALPIEIYLCEVERGLHNPRQKFIDICCAEKIVSNIVLLKKWASMITIWPRWIIKPIILVNQLIPGGQAHKIPYRHISNQLTPWQFCDIHDVLNSTPPHITFSGEEESCGLSVLKKMGIEKNDSIVCFMARDKAFYSEDHFRWDQRNSSVHTIMQALDDLTSKGYKAVRMGARVTERLQSTNPAIVDYATTGMRSELLDLFLISRCKFMVSTAVGLDSLAPTFRHPVVYVNLSDFGHADLWGRDAIFIPKKLRSIAKKRFLTFSEIFAVGAHLFGLAWQYKREGIEWIDNDVDEIRAAILEMEQRLAGTWVAQPEDELLQNQFRSLWPIRPAGRPVLLSRIGTEFLRNNRELLR